MGHAIIEKLQSERPKFHSQGGNPISWQSQAEVLNFIADNSVKGGASLETGCGYSSVVFAAVGWTHTVVTPAQAETDRVTAYCNEHKIDMSQTKFAIGKSEDVLPQLVDAGPLDFVYIDGAHRFPFPCIDWVYTERRLKVGGLMLVDDVQIPTCRMLHDFLVREHNWSLETFLGDTSVFRKTADANYSTDWSSQSYNKSSPDWSFLPPHRRIRKIGAMVRKLVRRA